MQKSVCIFIAVFITLSFVNCAYGETIHLPAQYLSTVEQANTINSLTRLNDEGTFYQLEYTADYKLDDLLASDISDLTGLIGWVRSNLLSTNAPGTQANIGGGCSAFVALNAQNKLIYGRNYDYVQNAQNILVHCTPKNGYASVSIAAGGWLFPFHEDGSPTLLDDGQTDVSMLVAAPFLLMDGMNEKGLIVAVLTVDGNGTVQAESGRHTMQTTTALRLALDRAATVPEAIQLWQQYNMHASIREKNFHFFMADASGNYAIVEYSPDGEMKYSMDENGSIPNLFSQTPPSYDSRLVTNFYRLFPASEYGFDDGEHGLDRFLALSEDIQKHEGRYSEAEAMDALRIVYQDFGDTATHETQWSVVYNPTDMTAKVCPRVQKTDHVDVFYQTVYDFSFTDAFQNGAAIPPATITQP